MTSDGRLCKRCGKQTRRHRGFCRDCQREISAERRSAIKRRRKKRTCLKCGRSFASDGPGHRICPKCAHANGMVRFKPRSVAKKRPPPVEDSE